MTAHDQQTLTEEQLTALYRALSQERMGTYLVAAGRDQARAMRLYIWNAQLAEAFYIPIQAVEVALRNSVHHALNCQFGSEWWKNREYLDLADYDRKKDLVTVKRRIKQRQQEENAGQVVAGLSFGFWVGMMQPRYNPDFWSRQLRTAFPYLPSSEGRKSIAKAASTIATLRNRISHHEPLIRRSGSEDFVLLMTTLEWLCPYKLEWIRPYCRVPDLLRQKP